MIFVMEVLFEAIHYLVKIQKTIILAFYYDELEVANPLGSKRGKHKLGLDKKIIFNVTFTTILCTM